MAEKSIEQKYKSLTDIEHVLLRPGMYIGSTLPTEKDDYVSNGEPNQLRLQSLTYVPAALKLVDEILSNSVDEHIRYIGKRRELPIRQQKSFRILDTIKVTVEKNGNVSVFDNGGIPVVMHKDENCWLPELLFGRMRTSSNYDDNEQREVVGTNGVGGSLANIFSLAFKVTTADGSNEYVQQWSSNLHNKSEAVIIASKNYFTRIDYTLDLKRLSLEEIGEGTMKLIQKKCILAAAANPGLSVEFNGIPYKFDNFKQYVEMYGFTDLIGESNPEWTFFIAPVPQSLGGRSFSIINGAECNGGQHVEHLQFQVNESLADALKKKHKIKDVDKKVLNKHYITFINATVANPTYSSQTKESLTSKFDFWDKRNERDFRRQISNQTRGAFWNSSIVGSIASWYASAESEEEKAQIKKLNNELKKKSVRSINGFIDTNASGSERKNAQLWVFEGESAQGHFRTTYKPQSQGSYALRGKVLNTWGMRTLDILNNDELRDIVLGFGLDINNRDNLTGLRFGSIVIATDADVDGYSICGQFISFVAYHFPELIRQGRIKRVVSPIVKTTKKGQEPKYFYSLEEFEVFNQSASAKGWSHEYYKGLGSLSEDDYRIMIQKPILQTFKLSNTCMQTIEAWMGPNKAENIKRFVSIKNDENE